MKNRLPIALSALVVLLFFGTLGALRREPGRVRGDEGTYLAMAESLARDGDLWFDRRDRERAEADPRPGRQALILQRVEPRVAYSKPIFYPLVAAALLPVAGEAALVLVNLLALGAALLVLWRFFRQIDPDAVWLPTLISFAGLGLLVAYLPWRTSDSLQASLTVAGLALALWDLRSPHSTDRGGPPIRLLSGGVLLGLVISLRLTNAVVALIPVAALALAGRRRRAAWAALAILGTLFLAAGASFWLAGAPSPYAAVRATFNPQTGYPGATDLAGPRSPFDTDRASYDRTKKLVEAPRASLYGAWYFLVGRHTGVLVYFPLAAFLFAAAVRERDRTARVVVLAVALLGAFYLVFLPFNYFGGATCVGNRYFLVSYAALPFALRRPLGRRSLAVAWGIGLLVAVSALASVGATRDRDPSTQNHAHAGIFRWLPFESTAASVDGIRDVFWNKELGRFVDPYAAVAPWSFRLDSRDPPTRIQVANRRRDERLRFLVLSSAPRLEFVYSDWGQRGGVRMEAPVGKNGLVEIEPSRPLRVHPLWFRNVWDHGLPYYVRAFQLAIRTPDGRPARAEVRYLGAEPWPEGIFEREVVSLELPARAAPATTTRLAVRLRNTSRRAWASEGVFPVRLSYRLVPQDGAPGAPVEGPRTRLVAGGGPDGEVHGAIDVTWPTEPGRYLLSVDLIVEGVAWFESRVGEPLAAGVVVVGEGAGTAG